jgi:hypothetical protein
MTGVEVPCAAHGGGQFRVKRFTDQRMPEGEGRPFTEVDEHPGGACFVNRGHHIGHGLAEYGREVGDGKLHTEQRGGPQDVSR